MISFLKWLNKYELPVHFLVTMLAFYSICLAIVCATAPAAAEALMLTFASGVLMVLVGVLSFKIATLITDAIKNAVARATIDQLRDVIPPNDMLPKEKIVDYTSSNVLVVKNVSDELKEAVSNLTEAASVTDEKAPAPPVQKKRGPKAKSSKRKAG